MSILRRVLDLLWPRNCEICGRPVDRDARYIQPKVKVKRESRGKTQQAIPAGTNSTTSVAIPTTLGHRIKRGYNQSALLAESLAKRLDRRFLGRAVARTGHPKRQSSLTEEERAENVKGTFGVREPSLVRGRTILLVDDIMTTGSTLSECSKTLKAAGAWRVWSVTLARSVRT